jgi:hypothetical protein
MFLLVGTSDYSLTIQGHQAMLKITITSTAIQTKSGISPRTNKPYEIREQAAWIHLVGEDGKQHPYPTQMMLMLDKNQPPHAIGDYILHPSSIQSGSFGSLRIKPFLMSVQQAVKAAA